MSTAVAIQHRDAIIAMAATGAHLADIAKHFGIQPPAISKHLANDPDYRAARETAAELRLEQRERELEGVEASMPEISRVSVLLRHQQWRCEREFPHRWGQKTETHVVTESYSDALKRISERNMRTVAPEQQVALQQSTDTDGQA